MNRCSWQLLHYSSPYACDGGKETAPVTMGEMLSLLFCITDLQGSLGQEYFTAFVLLQNEAMPVYIPLLFCPLFPSDTALTS